MRSSSQRHANRPSSASPGLLVKTRTALAYANNSLQPYFTHLAQKSYHNCYRNLPVQKGALQSPPFPCLDVDV